MKLKTVKTVRTPRKINAILLNVKLNWRKLVSMCGYKLATNCPNFTEVYFLSENFAKSFRGAGLLFLTHTVYSWLLHAAPSCLYFPTPSVVEWTFTWQICFIDGVEVGRLAARPAETTGEEYGYLYTIQGAIQVLGFTFYLYGMLQTVLICFSENTICTLSAYKR